MFVSTEYNFSRFNSFHMLDAFAFILQDTLTLFYYYSLPNCSIQFGIHKAILKQSSYKGNKIPFLVLFWVAKEILCTSNLLVSIFLWLLNWRTQSKSSGRQEIEQRCWVYLICELVCKSIFLLLILHFQDIISEKVGPGAVLCRTKVRDRQTNPFIVFVLLWILKEILYTRTLLVLMCLQIMNLWTQ